MKKTLLVLIIVFFIILVNISLFIHHRTVKNEQINNDNYEYEYYLNKKIYGTDVATIIDKAINTNEKNQIKKDKKNYYIENDSNSIKIELKMKTIDKTYAMEEFYNHNMVEFVRHFNLTTFECTNIEYHKKTRRISKILFEEI